MATREALLTFCRRAEEQQIASLWVSDHVVFPKVNTSTYPGGRFPHAPETPYLEPVTVLAAAAMCTAALRNTTIGRLRGADYANIAAACRRFAAQPDLALTLIGITSEN